MKHLFGLGQHPDADRLIAEYLTEHVRAGMTDTQLEHVREEAVRAATLGRSFPEYKALAPYEGRVAARLAVIRDQAKRAPTQAEIKMVRYEEARRHRAAVAGFDVVFAPVKSAALLWALDPRQDVRDAVREAHEAARDAALDQLEQHAAFTRTGSSGQAQIETKGLVAAVFDHFDSRAGDPNLHTHVAISTKVQGLDGRWRSLDGRALFAATVAVSEFYNSRFETELRARLDVSFVDRPSHSGKEPVREVEGMPEEFIRHFSSRRTEIEARYEQLVRTYRAEHGHDPSAGVAHKLARQANLDTREGKKAARSLQGMRADWRASLVERFGPQALEQLPGRALRTAYTEDHGTRNVGSPIDVQSLAAQVIGAVAEQRATWSVWNVRAQAERIVRRAHPSGTLEQHVQLVEEVTATAVVPTHSVIVSAPALLEEPHELRRSDGVSVFEQHASTRYTSRAVLDAEARLRDAALRPTAVGLSGPFTQASLDGFEGRKRPLDEGQRALVTAFATDTRLVVVGLGPAGSGKTAAMQAYVHVAAQAGQRVIPLATSAASAQVLGEDLGLTAENLHKFLWEWTRGPAAERLQRGHTVPPSRQSFALRPGDVVLLDEAGMAGTFNLDRLVRIAASRGAVVRLLGDYRQLGAVESGGALREIAATAGAVELTRLHRFTDPAEAEATLAIRVGDNTGLDFYQRADRMRGGSRTAMTEAAYEGWKADMLAGKVTLISAATGTEVTTLSARAREERVAAGQVEQDGVLLCDGNRAGRGDWIITRENNRRLSTARGRDFVKNGDGWRVLKRYGDGSLKVRHLTHGGRLVLPADYVEKNVQLLYASTITRSQGSTVDTAHPLVTDDMTREELYVALSRAREKTTLYTVTHDVLPYDTDPQVDLPRHDPDTYAAREVLELVLRRESAELSATATIHAHQEEAASLATLGPRFDHAVETLTRAHHTRVVQDVLDPDLARAVTEDDAFSAVTRALRRAGADGWQPEQILAAAARQGDLREADSPAQLLAWRINHHAENRTPTAHLAEPSREDAARYAALAAALLGIPAERLDPGTALHTPNLLRATKTAAATPGGHPHVPQNELDQHAQRVAAHLGLDATAVTEHPSWPALAGVLTAARRAGHHPGDLLGTIARDASDPLAALADDASARLAARGVPPAEQRVPAALRHRAAVHQALGQDLAHQARNEPAWPALTAALRRAEAHGHDPAELLTTLAAARSLASAQTVSSTLAWRVNRHLAQHPGSTVPTAASQRDAETWHTLAWTLKAAEQAGSTAENTLAGDARDLEALLANARDHARTVRSDLGADAHANLPKWLATPPAAPAMDPAHRDYLGDSAKLITDRVTALTERLTTSLPAWAEGLGPGPKTPPPARPGSTTSPRSPPTATTSPSPTTTPPSPPAPTSKPAAPATPPTGTPPPRPSPPATSPLNPTNNPPAPTPRPTPPAGTPPPTSSPPSPRPSNARSCATSPATPTPRGSPTPPTSTPPP
jgi:conjugative relaxase-like TrwC/TraI family protein